MTTLLGIDIGSSSIICGILKGKTVLKESPRAFFRSKHSANKVEVAPETVLKALSDAIKGLGKAAQEVDAIALATMCPAWCAMDKRGKALTPIVTHQDRRSVAEAHALEKKHGKAKHLRLVGCRPFPGGISSTTWAWYRKNEPERLKNADLVGHLSTYLHRHMTGARVTDPSCASFTGLYHTTKCGGWHPELCKAVGAKKSQLPDVKDADVIAGRITKTAAKRFGLKEGTPMMTGLIDGSAGMLLAGAEVGQLFNVCGSTDVLALCTDKPQPHPKLLTRALGVDGKFLMVGTLAAVASSLYWWREQSYPEVTVQDFPDILHKLARRGAKASGGVTFDPYMAGERTSINQRTGGFKGITLATNREHILSAMVEGLISASAERLPLMMASKTTILPTVAVSGGGDRLDKLMRRDWPGKWRFRAVTDATMRGLGTLTPKEG
ncbi:MAG: FGGY family carbohydrate kinase [Verrucomicrobiota bacterium]